MNCSSQRYSNTIYNKEQRRKDYLQLSQFIRGWWNYSEKPIDRMAGREPGEFGDLHSANWKMVRFGYYLQDKHTHICEN